MGTGGERGFPGPTSNPWSQGRETSQAQARVAYRPTTPNVEDTLPRFGWTGVTTPADITVVGPEKQNWKSLLELPKLCIPSGEAWVRNMTMVTWVKEVELASTTVSVEFAMFVKKGNEPGKEQV